MKRLAGIVLVLMCVFCFSSALAYEKGPEISSDVYKYVIQRDGNACITGYTGKITSILTIPASIDGLHVTTIGEYAFDGAAFSGVTIPDTVVNIEFAAFNQCNNLERVRIPDNVVYISGNPFTNCAKLDMINVSPKHPTLRVMSDGVLYSINTNTLLCYPCALTMTEYTVLPNTQAIARNAFEGCNTLEKITIPSTVTTIREEAFAGCKKLKSITLPDSVTSLGMSAFQRCVALEKVKLSAAVPVIKGNTFYGCEKLSEITIPESVTTIESGAFAFCKNLSKVSIPTSVFEIGKRAFYSCAIREIEIPSSVTIIGEDTFEENPIYWFAVEDNSFGYLYGTMYQYRIRIIDYEPSLMP